MNSELNKIEIRNVQKIEFDGEAIEFESKNSKAFGSGGYIVPKVTFRGAKYDHTLENVYFERYEYHAFKEGIVKDIELMTFTINEAVTLKWLKDSPTVNCLSFVERPNGIKALGWMEDAMNKDLLRKALFSFFFYIALGFIYFIIATGPHSDSQFLQWVFVGFAFAMLAIGILSKSFCLNPFGPIKLAKAYRRKAPSRVIRL